MRTLFTLMWVLVLALMLYGMWRGWRARTRRDADVLGTARPLTGEIIARFGGQSSPLGGLQYVSTTPSGEPLSRVAAPGLRYRGPAEIVVRADGVTIQVVGEPPLDISAGRVRGTDSAGRRIGKAVETGGLAILRWNAIRGGQPADGRVRERTTGGGASAEADPPLESSFRFASRDEQERFDAAIARIAHTGSEQ